MNNSGMDKIMMTEHNRKNNRASLATLMQFLLIMVCAFLVRSFGYGLYRVPSGSMETTMLVGEFFFANKYTYLIGSPMRGHIVAFNDPTFTYSSNRCMRWWQHHVWGPANLSKRVIGVPGDHIHGTIENGTSVVYVNNVRMNEQYVNAYPLIGVYSERHKNADTMQQAESEITFKTIDPTKSFEEQPWYAIDVGQVLYNNNGDPVMRYQSVEPGAIVRMSEAENVWDGSDEFDVHLGDNEYWVMGDSRNNSVDSRSFGPISGEHVHGKIVYRLFSVDLTSSLMIIDFLLHPITFYKSIRWSRCMEAVE